MIAPFVPHRAIGKYLFYALCSFCACAWCALCPQREKWDEKRWDEMKGRSKRRMRFILLLLQQWVKRKGKPANAFLNFTGNWKFQESNWMMSDRRDEKEEEEEESWFVRFSSDGPAKQKSFHLDSTQSSKWARRTKSFSSSSSCCPNTTLLFVSLQYYIKIIQSARSSHRESAGRAKMANERGKCREKKSWAEKGRERVNKTR